MADSESMAAVSPEAEVLAEEEELITNLDIFLFSLLAGLLIYWFFSRKKPPEIPQLRPIPTVVPPMRETSFIEKMKKASRNIVVFYGSQTGTAEAFATQLAKDAQRYGMKGMPADPEEYDMSELSRLTEIPGSLVVFCVATYGEGDPTDNAQDFYDWMQAADDSLEGVNYAVFGLGNKTYEHYNAMGKYVDKRLAELGARRVFDLGLGDDDGNLEEDFVSWKELFWPAVCEFFGAEATGDDCCVRQFELVTYSDLTMTQVFTGEMSRLRSYQTQRPPFDAKNPFLAEVTANRKLNKGGERHLMHLELDISGSKLRYDAGDHVAVYPTNDVALVTRLGEVLTVELDMVISLNNLDEESNKKHPFPCPCSYRTALTHYLDITSPPRTNVLYELAQYATDPQEQDMLRKMASASAEGKALYQSWVLAPQRHILAVLEDMRSLRPPVDHLCELLPRLQARYYSIASSAKVHPSSVHICAVVVEYSTSAGRTNKGVATTWLRNKVPAHASGHSASMPAHASGPSDSMPAHASGPSDSVPAHASGPSARVPLYVRKSQFRLPFKASTPVVTIGPGTGIAPFMGFLQERAWQKEQGKEVGETVLYYGCRHRNEDFLYQEELEEFERRGVLTQLNVAVSRDQEHKIYVQHLMKKNKEHLWRLIHSQNAHLYVCGDARNMARDVQSALHQVAEEVGGLTHTQAVDYYKRLMTKGRYSQDVWS